MLGIGWGEMLVIGLVALVVVGPDKLPEMARTIGQLYGQLRRAADEAGQAFSAEVDLLNTRPDPAEKARQATPAQPDTGDQAQGPTPAAPLPTERFSEEEEGRPAHPSLLPASGSAPAGLPDDPSTAKGQPAAAESDESPAHDRTQT